MTAAAEAIRIGSAAQLKQTLELSELHFRLAALNAIQQQPAKALAFGLHDGKDVIDMLLGWAKRTEGTVEWLYYVVTLAAFRDARVTDFYTTVLATSTDSELLFTAAEYLSASLNQTLEYRCRRLLWDEHPARVRAVVSLLSGSKLLDDSERIRIGIIALSDETPLPVFSQTCKLWLRKLDGPFRGDAQICLERQGWKRWMIFSPLGMAWLRRIANGSSTGFLGRSSLMFGKSGLALIERAAMQGVVALSNSTASHP